jgi:hypothetical protein
MTNTKRVKNIDPCDAIWWFIDCLGSQDLLEPLVKQFDSGARVSIKDGRQSDIWKSHSKMVNKNNGSVFSGLHHTGAHWHFCINGIDCNSYPLEYQIAGTQHFCQTFALICFLRQSKLFEKRDYIENVIKCVEWWENMVKYNKFVKSELMSQIHATVENGDSVYDEITQKHLSDFKYSDLATVFQYIKDNADAISKCH